VAIRIYDLKIIEEPSFRTDCHFGQTSLNIDKILRPRIFRFEQQQNFDANARYAAVLLNKLLAMAANGVAPLAVPGISCDFHEHELNFPILDALSMCPNVVNAGRQVFTCPPFPQITGRIGGR
jgi:hypothetical protein